MTKVIQAKRLLSQWIHQPKEKGEIRERKNKKKTRRRRHPQKEQDHPEPKRRKLQALATMKTQQCGQPFQYRMGMFRDVEHVRGIKVNKSKYVLMQMYKIQSSTLHQLTFTELQVLSQKVVKVTEEDQELFEYIRNKAMPETLPKGHMNPKGVIFHDIRGGLGNFNIEKDMKPQNKRKLIELISLFKKKSSVSEEDKQIVIEMSSYVASLSKLDPIEKSGGGGGGGDDQGDSSKKTNKLKDPPVKKTRRNNGEKEEEEDKKKKTPSKGARTSRTKKNQVAIPATTSAPDLLVVKRIADVQSNSWRNKGD